MYSYKYPRASITVDAVIFQKITNKILLIRRGIDPYAGKWALPGGFVEENELLSVACKRELKEETGLSIKHLRQLKAYDKIDRDPRGRTISIAFYGFTDEENSQVKGGDDAAFAKWFPINLLPSLAFDHDLIIRDFILLIKQSLKN